MEKVNDLNEKQKRFCEEYIVDLNGTQACIRAGYSQKTARQVATENLSKPNIQNYILQLREEQSGRTLIKADNVIKELAKIGFSDIKDFLSFNGDKVEFKNSDEVDGTLISEVSSVKTTTEGTTQRVNLKLKLHDKLKALEMLGRHLILFTDKIDNNHSGNLVIEIKNFGE